MKQKLVSLQISAIKIVKTAFKRFGHIAIQILYSIYIGEFIHHEFSGSNNSTHYNYFKSVKTPLYTIALVYLYNFLGSFLIIAHLFIMQKPTSLGL